MSFGNVPPEMLAGAVEKLLAKMDETDLADFYERELSAMPSDAAHAFVEALLGAFHDRGESSEDAAEGAETTLDAIAERRPEALAALVRYARANPDLVKEATTAFVERRPDLIAALPATLRDALAARLAGTGS
jgi:ABC-type transporter Mla subunit MlaD